jgi:hypothetical protein
MLASSLYDDPLGAVVLFFVVMLAVIAVCVALRSK